jgi:uncharacterized protein YhbP (UPF0306 family)
MSLELKNAEYASERMSQSVLRILQAVELCSIATVGANDDGYINTAFFCYTPSLDFYFVSDTETIHSQNIARSPKIAIAVFDTHQPWGEPVRGLQLFGDCHLANALESAMALKTHAARFHAYGDYMRALSPLERDKSPYRFYLFRPTTLKIADEAEFGEECFITADIIRS